MDPMERIEKFFLANMGKVDERELPYDPRPSDVVIVGPAKSGTTWLQQILHQIRTKGDENFEVCVFLAKSRGFLKNCAKYNNWHFAKLELSKLARTLDRKKDPKT